MKYTPKGYEGKVYNTIREFQDKGISKVDLRFILNSSPEVVGKAIGNLMFRELIEEKEGKLYAK